MSSQPLSADRRFDDDPQSVLIHSDVDVGALQVELGQALISRANDAFLSSIGSSEREVVGADLLALGWSEGKQELAAFVLNSSGSDSSLSVTARLARRDGSNRWFDLRARKKAGSQSVTIIAFDVTAHMEAQAELQSLHDRERDELTSLRRERDSMREELEESSRGRTEFVAMLSHELRNPLAPIRNATRIARTPTTTPDQLQWSLGVIERQVQHIARFVDDLLDVSRITRGRLQLRCERTRLNDAISSAVEVTRPLLDARGHTLNVDMPSEPLWMVADPVRLAQVFGNLLTNAAKYTSKGGEISVTVAQEDGNYVVTIRDNGEGISVDLLPRVFDLFTQNPSHGRREGGLGIGLALVKGLVKLHNGTVDARSDGPGSGSEFTVRLPMPVDVFPTSFGNGNMQESATTGATRQLRILVADDNIDAADSLAMLLRLQGHDVRVAHDGMGAVREAEAFRPDVALLDIGMPIMSGHDVARWIRSQGWGATVRVVALTGWNQPMDRVQTSLSGFDKHLAKPVSMQDLLACFAQASDPVEPQSR